MRHRNVPKALLMTAAVIALALPVLHGQTKAVSAGTKSNAALKLFESAESARKTGDLPTSIKLYQRAIAADPENEKAHSGLRNALFLSEQNRLNTEARAAGKDPDMGEMFKKVAESINLKLIRIYRALASAHPNVVAYRFQLAQLEHGQDGKLQAAVEKIIADHPRYAPALHLLAGLQLDNPPKCREYNRRAMEAAPDNALYAFGYVRSFRNEDPKEFRRLINDYVKRFPKSPYNSSLLYEAANLSEDPAERQSLLERFAEEPNQFHVNDLLALYARNDTAKSVQLAQKKLDVARSSNDALAKFSIDDLKTQLDYYSAVAYAQELFKAGKFAEARTAIEKAEPPKGEVGPASIAYPKVKLTTEILLAQGNPSDAYKNLLGEHEIIADADLTAMAVKIGAQLGKSESQVDNEMVTAFLASVKQVPEFEVETLKGDAKIRLSELRGKYVWLNSWHPT